MKVRVALFATMVALMVAVSAAAQPTAVRRPLVNRPLTDVLREWQRSGLRLVFSSEVVRPSLRIAIEPRALGGRQLLDELLAAHALEVREMAGGVLLVVPRRTDRAATPQLAPLATATPVRGMVLDGRTGAPLPDVLIRIDVLGRAGVTDAHGRFDLGPVPPGTHQLLASLVGYSLVEEDLAVAATPLDVTIVLTDGARTHSEAVDVVGDRFRGVATSTPSATTLSGTDMRELRGVLTDDAFRAVQVMPGIITGHDFRSEFSIRGSDYRHVGLLVDGLMVAWPIHAVREDWSGGSIGMINADTIDSLTVMAGVAPQDRPSKSGGWIDLVMREGSRTRTQAHAALGMTAASLITEGPLGSHGQGSWIVSARQSYLQWVAKRLGATGTTFGYGDVFGKVVLDPTPRHHLEMLTVFGRSLLELDRRAPDPNLVTRGEMRTGVAAASWRLSFSKATLTQRLGVSTTSFVNDGPLQADLGSGHGREVSWRADAVVAAGRVGTLYGGVYTRHRTVDQRFHRGVGFVNAPRTLRTELINGTSSEWLAHVRAAGRLGRLSLDGGLQVSSTSPRDVSPWLTVKVPAGRWSVRAGAGVTRQRPELEQSASSFASPNLRAEISHQFDLEVERTWGDSSRIVVTTYRRDDRDGLRLTGDEFRLQNGVVAAPSLLPQWRNTLRTRASGVEVVAQRRSPVGVSGWIAYAYATTRVEDVATGERWDADFDQRHTVNAYVQARISPVTSVSGKLRIGSNVPVPGYLADGPTGVVIGPERNRVRLPTYARLDLRATRAFNFSSRRLTLFAEIINVLGRENRAVACPCTNWADAPRVFADGRVIDISQRLFPFLPSVGIVIDF